MADAIDLDAKRAQRGPAATQEVILGGRVFQVPARLTVELGLAAAAGNLQQLMRGLFGSQLEDALAVEPPLEVADLLELVQALAGGPGNSRG